ncbi:hypothetical protein [Undibacterium oligocarboniphilum]|uniref:Uncharacterized protein n=1 Tax=Undibacterium oligocarboniphilum TaxID=666702 RepID=A0A850QRL9_9BURK|nr:hypothetical protein [Undibacterium oligocarboniphilum]MBC3871400.1 hypothetical protein [Undibacterium oligocarboniphilum]NVO79024.1 hypothetical protein [Undibacterium oligocarboniphilum]
MKTKKQFTVYLDSLDPIHQKIIAEIEGLKGYSRQNFIREIFDIGYIARQLGYGALNGQLLHKSFAITQENCFYHSGGSSFQKPKYQMPSSIDSTVYEEGMMNGFEKHSQAIANQENSASSVAKGQGTLRDKLRKLAD